MSPMKRAMLGGLLFFIAIVLLIGKASGNWHLGLHGGVYIAVVFTVWLESRFSR